jgi:hypothetical protein
MFAHFVSRFDNSSVTQFCGKDMRQQMDASPAANDVGIRILVVTNRRVSLVKFCWNIRSVATIDPKNGAN